MRRTTRIPALLLSSTLVLTACSGSGDDPDEPAAGTGAPTAEPEVTAEWTQVAMDARALPNHPNLNISDSVPGDGDLPLLYVGSSAAPGEPGQATVWRGAGKDLGTAQVLDVPGTDTSLGGVATDGETTVVTGYSWEDGTSRPFAQTSADRTSWADLNVPDAVTERSLYFSEVVVLPGGAPLAMGIDEEDVTSAINLESGDIVDLPPWKKVKPDTVSALATHDDAIVALIRGQQLDGGDTTVAYTSADGGATWQAAGPLPGEETSVAGVVATERGLVATGSREVGTETTAAAWTSSDGTQWQDASPPPQPGHRAGWSTWLRTPVLLGGSVHVPYIDDEKLYTTVLRLTPGGSWDAVETLPDWEGPGTDLRLERDGRRLHGVRTGYGHLETGRLEGGNWTATGGTPRVQDPVSWWSSIGLDGEEPVLVGGTQEVILRGGGSWSRVTELDRFSISDNTVHASQWRPRSAEGLAGTAITTAPGGRTALLGERINPGTGATDGADVVGWFRDPGGKWKSARGLGGPRTEFLSDLIHTGKEWVAVGSDRDSFTGSDHTRAALWTSANGKRWKRAQGPFDPAADRDSWLSAACPLPDGSLLALGGIENPGTGQAPLAFRRVDGAWQRHDLSGLPEGVTSVTGCATVGDEVVIQGISPDEDAWTTSDALTFTPIEIGTDDDHVGSIVAFDGGFAAPGGLYEGTSSQPVVWLSTEGREWHPVAIPTERQMTSYEVMVWGDRLLVALTSESGAGVATLDNPTEVLGSL